MHLRRGEKIGQLANVNQKCVIIFLPVTSPNADRFSKFFYHDTRQKICNKIIICHKRSHSTSQWSVLCLFFTNNHPVCLCHIYGIKTI